jgi:hypothetical protein
MAASTRCGGIRFCGAQVFLLLVAAESAHGANINTLQRLRDLRLQFSLLKFARCSNRISCIRNYLLFSAAVESVASLNCFIGTSEQR